jgi:hypothetical protein
MEQKVNWLTLHHASDSWVALMNTTTTTSVNTMQKKAPQKPCGKQALVMKKRKSTQSSGGVGWFTRALGQCCPTGMGLDGTVLRLIPACYHRVQHPLLPCLPCIDSLAILLCFSCVDPPVSFSYPWLALWLQDSYVTASLAGW